MLMDRGNLPHPCPSSPKLPFFISSSKHCMQESLAVVESGGVWKAFRPSFSSLDTHPQDTTSRFNDHLRPNTYTEDTSRHYNLHLLLCAIDSLSKLCQTIEAIPWLYIWSICFTISHTTSTMASGELWPHRLPSVDISKGRSSSLKLSRLLYFNADFIRTHPKSRSFDLPWTFPPCHPLELLLCRGWRPVLFNFCLQRFGRYHNQKRTC